MHNLSKWMPILTRGLVVALGGLVTLGCDAVVCGDGTISAGTQGYCPTGDCGVLTSTAIPPIQALAIVEGTLKPEDRDAYPSSGSRLLAWDMQYVGETKPNLHELFHSSYDRRQDSEWAAVGQLSLNQPKKGPWTSQGCERRQTI